MEQTVRVRAELILTNLAEKFRNSNPGLVSECRFARYDTHYSLIFKLRKYNITTTIKLNLDFTLKGVYSFIPVESGHLVKNHQDAKNRLNTRFQSYAEAIALPALRKIGVAA
ncbi:hypothetical protein FQZ97_879060 [compost metagenome]